MQEIFDIGEMLYQKFLLDIYRHCEKIKKCRISPGEKEMMAGEMVDFIGHVILSLESKKPLVKIANRNEKVLERLSKLISERVLEDVFAKSVLDYYVSKRKLPQKKIPSYLTIAAITVLSKGRRTDMKVLEKRILSAKPFLFRVASLLSPAVFLHERLLEKTAEEEKTEEVLSEGNFDMSFMKYIG